MGSPRVGDRFQFTDETNETSWWTVLDPLVDFGGPHFRAIEDGNCHPGLFEIETEWPGSNGHAYHQDAARDESTNGTNDPLGGTIGAVLYTRHPAPREAVEDLIEAAGHHDCMRHETYRPGMAPGCELCDAIARVQSDNGGRS